MFRPTLLFALATFLVPACDNGASDDEKKEEGDGPPYDLTCTVCVDWENWDDQSEFGCSESGASWNQGQPCVLGGETLDSVVVTYTDCRREPVCPGEPGVSAVGGAGSLGDWDYECHFCGGDIREIDGAHDGGAEDSGCEQVSTLRNVGDDCGGGEQATVVAFSDCDEVPECAQ